MTKMNYSHNGIDDDGRVGKLPKELTKTYSSLFEDDKLSETKETCCRNNLASSADQETNLSAKQSSNLTLASTNIDNGHSGSLANSLEPSERQITNQGGNIDSSNNILVKRINESRESNDSWSFTTVQKFYCWVIFFPVTILSWYASAILFPSSAREKVSFLLWTDGSLIKDAYGRFVLCPRSSICAEGILQITLVATSRLTAFSSYVVMSLTFLSKMHSLIYFLSKTYVAALIPLGSLHSIHKYSGKLFWIFALIHTIAHYIRYVLRRETAQLGTRVHISGLVAILSMSIVVLSMSKIAKKRFTFEKRFNTHWLFLIVASALIFHTARSRNIAIFVIGIWSLDYIYGIFGRIYRVSFAEFKSIDSDGTQMLWKIPPGFSVNPGEYVSVKLPWLKTGSNQWHPFTVYQQQDVNETFTEERSFQIDAETGEDENLYEFINRVCNEFAEAPKTTRLYGVKEGVWHNNATVQIFIRPVGDWTEGLLKQVQNRKQLQSCYIKGPFISPFGIAHTYSNFIMMASGVGITPALGLIGQYPGYSRTKVLMWSTQSKKMIQFFAPLLRDAHLTIIYYTGEPLQRYELRKIRSYGNLFVHQERAKDLPHTLSQIITQFENKMNIDCHALSIEEIDLFIKKSWCVLYCGGRIELKDVLERFAQQNSLGWECEMFRW